MTTRLNNSFQFVEVERDEALIERLEETAHKLYQEVLAIRG